MSRAIAIATVVVIGACGGEDPKPARAPQQRAAAPANAPEVGTPGAVRRIEAEVVCDPPPEDAKKCDPNATHPLVIGKAKKTDDDGKICSDGKHCIQTSAGYLCGVCQERDTIRHSFRDRDFAEDNNRDPFRSTVIKSLDDEDGDKPKIAQTSRCAGDDQKKNLRVPNYGYQDLKLHGIARQGTRWLVLLVDPSNLGHAVWQGECVGKERAYVKTITENSVCFEPMAESKTAAIADVCLELHSNKYGVTQLPTDDPASGGANVPIVTPGTSSAPPARPAPAAPPGQAAPPPQPVPPASGSAPSRR